MSCLVAFHYRSYGTFFLHSKRLHNFHGGFTHYRNYRALFCLQKGTMKGVAKKLIEVLGKALKVDNV